MSKSSRPESPEVDFSVIRTSIDMGHKMVDQILHGIHYGSEEVRNLLREECDFILECKVCRNLFRSFPNFVAHKRVYCLEYHEEKMQSEAMQSNISDTDTIVVQPVAPDDREKSSNNTPNTSSVVKEVIANQFEGKSKEYQFYTKVAEDVEKRKATKTTNSIVLTSMPGCSNAVQVQQSEGDVTESSSAQNSGAEKKQSPVKDTEKNKSSPTKNKNSIKDLCADLLKKQLGKTNQNEMTPVQNARPLRATTRSRKSSPRRSLEYTSIDNTAENNEVETEPMVVDEVSTDDNEKPEKDSINKDILVFCDTKKLSCKVCKIAFDTPSGLSKHVEKSHVKTVVKHRCPCCKQSFREFSFLTQHLKSVHQKSDMFINGLKARLNSRTYDKFEPSPSNSPVKSNKGNLINDPSGKLLSYSTGWKKCDKCSKVCWKAKSYRRHYASCKGPVPSQTSSPEKPKSQQNPVNNSAFTKLEEKLRASVIKTIYPDDGKRNIGKKANVESEGPSVKNVLSSEQKMKLSRDMINSKDGVSDFRSGQFCRGKQAIANAVRLLQSSPPASESASDNLSNRSRAVTSGAAQGKSYNLRVGNLSSDNSNPKEIVDNSREVTASKTVKDVSSLRQSEGVVVSKDLNRDSPGLKKLEKRLVREAGLEEATKVVYPCRNLFKEGAGNNNEIGKSIKTEADKSDSPIVMMKERRTRNESPEIKQLMEKLTREACEPGEKSVEGVNNESEKEKVTEAKDVDNDDEATNKVVEKSNMDEMVENEAESKGGEEKVSSLERRRSRTLRRESAPEQSSEKLMLDTNLSPASSPGRVTNHAASPTPSMTSTDSYNLKFKMTVQEMAELVESASLTKFAKERKKRARTILNKKQIKEAQKINPSLSRPMKRQVKKKNIVIRNVYGTRNRGQGSLDDIQDDIKSDSSSSPLARTEAQLKKLSREQKRLMNSAGFVEENLYRVSSVTKELEKDSDANKQIRKSRMNAENPVVEKVNDDKDKSSLEIIDINKTLAEVTKQNNLKKLKRKYKKKRKVKTPDDSNSTLKVRNTSVAKVHVRSRDSKDGDLKSSPEENTKNQSESRHRTRLSTGSIYFDSELLKLSPKKVEKIISDRNKQSNDKDGTSVDMSNSVTVKISYNDRRKPHSGHNRSKSAPQFYSLATGVKQCPKCKKRFWKTLTYRHHMSHSSCSDKKPSRKRALSNTPESKIDVEEKDDDTSDSKSKRSRGNTDEISNKDEPNSEKKAHESEKQGISAIDLDSSLKDGVNVNKELITQGSENLENVPTDEVDSISVPKNDNKSTNSKSGVAKDSNPGAELLTNTKQAKEATDAEIVGIEAVAGPSGSGAKQVNTADDNNDDENDDNDDSGSDFSGFSEDDLRTSELELCQIEMDDSLNHEDENTSKDKIVDDDDYFNDDGDDDDDFADEDGYNDLIDGAKMLFNMKQTRSTSHVTPRRPASNVTPRRSASKKTPRRPASNVTPRCQAAKVTPQRQATNVMPQSPAANVMPQRQATNVTPQNTASNETTQHSARRSSADKSPDVEEIWVYKRPGKPVTTLKIKGGNREFVTDVSNPNKIVVHCTKEVNKLIDEENMKCKQCDCPCTSMSNLRRHVIRHLGWKRYKCKLCSFACYDLSHCRLHTSRHHQVALTKCNFDEMMTDLKREANALRSVKRRKTREKTKEHASDEDIYKKTFL
ncbi:hypothetical protein ACF0H5_022454 [Mactra antiquata]